MKLKRSDGNGAAALSSTRALQRVGRRHAQSTNSAQALIKRKLALYESRRAKRRSSTASST